MNTYTMVMTIGIFCLIFIWAVYEWERAMDRQFVKDAIDQITLNNAREIHVVNDDNDALQAEVQMNVMHSTVLKRQLEIEEKDNAHFRLVTRANIVFLNELREDLRHLKSQLANRKGQITVLRRKLKQREPQLYSDGVSYTRSEFIKKLKADKK
jgi:hypothetical protein